MTSIPTPSQSLIDLVGNLLKRNSTWGAWKDRNEWKESSGKHAPYLLHLRNEARTIALVLYCHFLHESLLPVCTLHVTLHLLAIRKQQPSEQRTSIEPLDKRQTHIPVPHRPCICYRIPMDTSGKHVQVRRGLFQHANGRIREEQQIDQSDN